MSVAMLALMCGPADAASTDTEALRKEIEQLRLSYEQRLSDLERRLEATEAASTPPPPLPAGGPSDLDTELAEVEPPQDEPPSVPASTGTLWSRGVGGANVQLLDLSAVIMGAVGGSSASPEEIEQLQGGAHDPKRNGFTFQQLELGLRGAVDPYFTAEAFIAFAEDAVELEEAFFTTTSLPWNLQLEGGYFLTDFGLNNPTHPHTWDWVDQPVINTRLFSGDGTRAAGFRLAELLPTPWYSEFMIGAQDPTNDTMISFLGEGHSHGDDGHGGGGETIGGYERVKTDVSSISDIAYLARWVNAWDNGPGTSAKWGFSGLFGPNSTGDGGRTSIAGTDLRVKWRPGGNFRGWPFVSWTTEFEYRYFRVDRSNPGFVAGETDDVLTDYGLYSELLYGFRPRWSAGIRVEYVTGSGNGPDAREQSPLRDNRVRISPMLSWYPSEYSRFHLQYNYDDAGFLEDGNASTVWLGAEVLFGRHTAHTF